VKEMLMQLRANRFFHRFFNFISRRIDNWPYEIKFFSLLLSLHAQKASADSAEEEK
jgi:hypothetical protein